MATPSAADEPLLTAEGVSFSYPGEAERIVSDVSLQLRRGRVVGIFGVNACGKTTLAKCLDHQLQPEAGAVTCAVADSAKRADGGGSSPSSSWGGMRAYLLSAVLLCVLAAAGTAAAPHVRPLLRRHRIAPELALGVAGALALLLAVGMPWLLGRLGGAGTQKGALADYVTFATSEDSPGNRIPQKTTIEDMIAEHMAAGQSSSESPEEASDGSRATAVREQVVALLEESGFQRYNQTTGEKEGTPREYIEEGLTIGECSGGQKQLIYILRQLAARKPVLLCDELMIGLDMERQGRLLAMMRKRKPDLALLWITTDLHWMAVMCTSAEDEVLFMHEGAIVERRPGGADGGEMLSKPSHPKASEYVAAFRSMLREPGAPLGQAIEAERLKADYKLRKAAERAAKVAAPAPAPAAQ